MEARTAHAAAAEEVSQTQQQWQHLTLQINELDAELQQLLVGWVAHCGFRCAVSTKVAKAYVLAV